MKLCNYCSTEHDQSEKYCSFCNAELDKERIKANELLDETQFFTKQELEQVHTVDLTRILRFLRQERSFAYKTMQTVRKAPEQAKNEDFNELNEFGQANYRELTKRQRVVEQIFVDRFGYFPKRIDENFIDKYVQKLDS